MEFATTNQIEIVNTYFKKRITRENNIHKWRIEHTSGLHHVQETTVTESTRLQSPTKRSSTKTAQNSGVQNRNTN